jgi:(p)ppGpp synthase/HD superfamily hydrolase
MKFTTIENDRVLKIKSLLIGNIDQEVDELKMMISEFNFSKGEISKILNTLNFALAQTYGENPMNKYYVNHPIRVAKLSLMWLNLIKEKNFDLIILALIHNALEKNIIPLETLRSEYSQWVYNSIITLTVNRSKENDPDYIKQYYYKLQKTDKYTQMLKVFDKLDNIYSLCLNPDDEIRSKYLQEIRNYIVPIINQHANILSGYFNELINSKKTSQHKSMDSWLVELQ